MHMEAPPTSMTRFNKQQYLSVAGFTRNIYTQHMKPKEIILLCLSFYQSECFVHPNNMNIQSSKGSLNDTVLSRRDDESSEHFASVYGAFRIDAKLKARRVRWKLKVIESCCMRIGITADKADCDNVLSVNGHHRFHTLNDSGQLRCHRSQVSLGEMNILKNNDIVEIWLSLDDDDSATILFMVSYTGDDGEHELPVVVTQKVNLCSEYRLVVFMSKHYGTHPHGQVQLLDFAIDQ